jgi:hypothetical protein
MVIILDRHKEDFARICPTCKGHPSLMHVSEEIAVKAAVARWGKAGNVYEGKAKPTEHGIPQAMVRVDCPSCGGAGTQMYVPKNDLIV